MSGHVDGMATIVAREDEGEAVRFTLEAPPELAKFIAPKGSVALDGTSLTVNGVEGNRFDVLLIHHSLEVTTWGERQSATASTSKSIPWRATRQGWRRPDRAAERQPVAIGRRRNRVGANPV